MQMAAFLLFCLMFFRVCKHGFAVELFFVVAAFQLNEQLVMNV